MRPNDPRLWLVGIVVFVVFVAVIIWGHSRPIPAPRRGLRAMSPTGETIHVPVEAPCHIDRYRLACERWAAGWPRCTAQPTGGTILAVTYTGTERGATAAGILAQRPDTCGNDDPTTEHEIGHALYDLADIERTGTVMCSHEPVDGGPHRPLCAGLAFPEYTP